MNCLGAATLADGRVTPPYSGSPMAHRFSIQDYEQVRISFAACVHEFHLQFAVAEKVILN